MRQSEEKLRELAARLFTEGKVDMLIGFEQGSLPGRSRPCIIRAADDAQRLVWNQTCSNNLTVYLPELFRLNPRNKGEQPPPPKVGIVVKGCDALSISLLVKEKQAPRKQLVVIGMPCGGIVNPETGEVLPSCEECRNPEPKGADVTVEGSSREPVTGPDKRLAAFEALPGDQRWRYFEEQMAKCIRCYACRQACPNCYCRECFAEQTSPRWIGIGNDPSDTMLYHIGRMFHQAGRCVGCDACARACPVGVDLHVFTRKLVEDAKRLFDYEISLSPDEQPLLCRFAQSDSDSFITDPDKGIAG